MESRTGSFHMGLSGTMPVHSFTPNSVLQQYMLSPNNGNSAADAARQTPMGQLPSQNGMAQSTYQAMNPSNYGTRLKI
jgi:hypothetical protein